MITSRTSSRWERSPAGAKLPKIFYVNWFRQDEKRGFLWPGYGENSRVLKWTFERCNGTVKAVDTPIGRLPQPADLEFAAGHHPRPIWPNC